MQGPPTSLVAADFDGDGSVDLVVNDVFRRGKHGKEPVVESQVLIVDVANYASTTVADWDGDERPDFLASLPRPTQHHLLFRNKGTRTALFAQPKKIDLPLIPVIGSVVRVFLADAKRDGDRDVLMLSGDGHDCLFEGSFLTHGRAKGEYVKLERRRP